MVTKMPQTALSTNSALELVAGLRPSQRTDKPNNPYGTGMSILGDDDG